MEESQETKPCELCDRNASDMQFVCVLGLPNGQSLFVEGDICLECYPKFPDDGSLAVQLLLKRGDRIPTDAELEDDPEAQDNEQRVDVVVAKYAWICLKCEYYSEEVELKEEVTCVACGSKFKTNPPEDAY